MSSKALLVLALLLASIPAYAQQPVHANNSFGWRQGAPSLSVAQSYVYAMRENGTMLAALVGVTCAATTVSNEFDCQAKIGNRPPGDHTYELIAIDTSTLTPLESPSSNPVSFTFRGPLPAPANLRTLP